MLEYKLTGYGGYAVKFSPYFNDRLAVAAAKNYGLVGNGALFALAMTDAGIREQRVYYVACPTGWLKTDIWQIPYPRRSL